MAKSGAFVRLHATLSLLRILIFINETDRGSGFLLGDVASLSRCPVTVLRTQFLKAYREKCFEFVIDHETYWDNADKDCRSRGGHLATIGDQETQAFVMDTLRSIGFNKHGLWIGLNDREHEQHWVWATGENLGSYRNWGDKQGNGITHLTDDCVHLRYIDSGHWHDSPCHLGTYHYTYICQYQMIPTTTSKTSVQTSPSTTATKSTAAVLTSATVSPSNASKSTSSSSPTSQTMNRTATAAATSTSSPSPTSQTMNRTATSAATSTSSSSPISQTMNRTATAAATSTSSPSPISQTMNRAATAAATSTSSSTTSSTTDTTTTTLSTRISPTTISKSTANPISTTTAATKATTSIASSLIITTLMVSSTTIPTETTKSTIEAVDANTISSTSTPQLATITTTLPMTSRNLSKTTILTVTTPTPPITSTATPTTDERKTPKPFKTIPPCQPLICGLDCGILGFVYANDGCPICACAS